MEIVTAGNVEVVRRIRPPLELTDEETIEFQRVISQMPADWFCSGNLAMLTQYCRHVIMARRIAEFIGSCMANLEGDGAKKLQFFIAAQARETKIIATLMTQLRLTPQSVAPRAVAVSRVHETENPWRGLAQKAITKATTD